MYRLKDIKIRENMFINQDVEFSWPNIENTPIIEKGRCLALKDQIAILVDGTVVPCCLDSNGIINLGNIYNDEIDDIINSERYKFRIIMGVCYAKENSNSV